MDPLNGAFVLEQKKEDTLSSTQKRERNSENDNTSTESPPTKKSKPNFDNIDLATIKSLSERKKALEQKLKIVNESLAKIDQAIENATAAKAEEDRLLEAQLEAQETAAAAPAQPKPKTPKKPKKTTRKKTSSSPASAARPKRQRKKSSVLREAEEAVPLPPGLESCKAVVTAVFNHRFGFPFLEPVDPVALKIPDYFTVVKNPMDFGTIRKKLITGKYEDVAAFKEDCSLVFYNACLYNHPGTDVYLMAETLREFFTKKMKPIEDRERSRKNKDETNIHELRKSVSTIKATLDTYLETAAAPVDKSQIPMSKAEMRQLSTTINSLSYKHLNTIIQIIQESMPALAVEGEIEIDLNSLDNATLRKLETFVGTVKKKKTRKKSNVSIESQRELARRSQEGTAKEIETVKRQIASLRDANYPARPETPASVAAPLAETPITTGTAPVEEETVRVDDSSSSDSESSSGSDSSGSDSESSDSDTDSGEVK